MELQTEKVKWTPLASHREFHTCPFNENGVSEQSPGELQFTTEKEKNVPEFLLLLCQECLHLNPWVRDSFLMSSHQDVPVFLSNHICGDLVSRPCLFPGFIFPAPSFFPFLSDHLCWSMTSGEQRLCLSHLSVPSPVAAWIS